MRGGAAERSEGKGEGDAAALALLERIWLFRLGVEAETLANIFTGEDAVNVSGPALAGLSSAQLQKKLDWLVRMRIVEASTKSSAQPHSPSDLKPETRNLKPFYSIHPAVRDGFLSGIGDAALRDNHEAVRQGLQFRWATRRANPSDPATLDLLEDRAPRRPVRPRQRSLDIYWNRSATSKPRLASGRVRAGRADLPCVCRGPRASIPSTCCLPTGRLPLPQRSRQSLPGSRAGDLHQ
ncbi:MAG: hypothetical protein U0X75_06885 [Acidobacteriota bacterium]